MAHSTRAILLASATAASFFGRRAKQIDQPRRAAARLGELKDRGGAQDEQLAQALIALAADAARSASPTGRVLLWRQAEPGGKVAARSGHPGVRALEGKADCGGRADARLGRTASGCRVLAVPSQQMGI